MKNISKFENSLSELEKAYLRKDAAIKEYILYAGIAKCFEVCLEYAWKGMKLKIEDQGLEAYSPKEIVKVAGQIGLVDNVPRWIDFINIRNFAVHDYLGITPQEYLNTIGDFLPEVRKLKKHLQD